jgi:hypothetical protein
MSFKPQTVILDSVTGYMDQGFSEQLKDDPKAFTYTQVKYGPIMGMWHRDMRVLRALATKGLNIGVVGHTKHENHGPQPS